MNLKVRKRTFREVRHAKIQISLRIRAVWSETSQRACWIDKDAKFIPAENEDSDQTARMRRLNWVVVERTCQKVRFLKLRLVRILTPGKTTFLLQFCDGLCLQPG